MNLLNMRWVTPQRLDGQEEVEVNEPALIAVLVQHILFFHCYTSQVMPHAAKASML